MTSATDFAPQGRHRLGWDITESATGGLITDAHSVQRLIERRPLDSLKALADVPLDGTYKGIPLGANVRLADLASTGWNVANGDLSYPVTTLSQDALTNNARTMAEYCRRNGVLHAPHGKTSMAPQLFAAQLDAGAWGITAATPTQAAVMRKFGVPRVLLANEVTDPAALRWMAGQMRDDQSVEIYSLADNPDVVRWADAVLTADAAAQGTGVQLPVFVEIGSAGGRCGVRNDEELLAVAEAVKNSRHLRLVGVESFEGAVAVGTPQEAIAAARRFFDRTRAATELLLSADVFESDQVLVSAGGSGYFDVVIEQLGSGWESSVKPVQLMIRSGGYISHDSGRSSRVSPLDGRRSDSESLLLKNALEAWARVVSRPEPGIAMLAIGKRDVPFDVDLPVPLRFHKADGTVTTELEGASVVNLMDQHAFLKVDPAQQLEPGDLVVLGVSHPCTAFDKNRFLPVVDDQYNVVDGVLTFF